MRGLGRVAFVAILLLIAGTLDFIYGIAGASSAHFFDNTQYVFGTVHTWGWITMIIGIIQFSAGVSLMAGRAFGRVFGIFAASLGALESLLAIGGTHPWWSLAIFAVCVWILHGLIVFEEDARDLRHDAEASLRDGGATAGPSSRGDARASTALPR